MCSVIANRKFLLVQILRYEADKDNMYFATVPHKLKFMMQVLMPEPKIHKEGDSETSFPWMSKEQLWG